MVYLYRVVPHQVVLAFAVATLLSPEVFEARAAIPLPWPRTLAPETLS